MSTDDEIHAQMTDDTGLEATLFDNSSLGFDPRRVSRIQAQLQTVVNRLSDPTSLVRALLDGIPVEVGTLDISLRASGIGRPGAIIHLAWPRLDTRIGVGIENTISHAIVDYLLGFSRLPVDATRQVTPVEFGVLTFVAARALDRLDARPGPWGAWDMTIERLGPDAFNASDLGPIVTIRLPISLRTIQGAIRVWIPESLLSNVALQSQSSRFSQRESPTIVDTTWRVEAGTINLARGLSRLKVNGVLPIDGGSLKGTVATPTGPVRLVCDRDNSLSIIEVEPVANTSGAWVRIQGTVQNGPVRAAKMFPDSPEGPALLVIELGRVNLSTSRLDDLSAGDLLELTRHAGEPVDLTCAGKLVARCELIQIDTELGVRVKSVLT